MKSNGENPITAKNQKTTDPKKGTMNHRLFRCSREGNAWWSLLLIVWQFHETLQFLIEFLIYEKKENRFKNTGTGN